jgi:hypothetical protein
MDHEMGQVTCVWSMDHEQGQETCLVNGPWKGSGDMCLVNEPWNGSGDMCLVNGSWNGSSNMLVGSVCTLSWCKLLKKWTDNKKLNIVKAVCIAQEKNATSTSWLHCSRDDIYIYIYTYAYICKTQIDVHSYQRSILKFMSHFYITDCTSDLYPFLRFSNRSPMFSNLWPFLTFSNRCPMTSLKYALTLNITNKSAIDLRIRKGCRFENTFKSDRDSRQ